MIKNLAPNDKIYYCFTKKFYAQMVKLADTPDLGSGAARCEGSSPFLGILLISYPPYFYV